MINPVNHARDAGGGARPIRWSRTLSQPMSMPFRRTPAGRVVLVYRFRGWMYRLMVKHSLAFEAGSR